jgi:penicillin-binding protein 1A
MYRAPQIAPDQRRGYVVPPAPLYEAPQIAVDDEWNAEDAPPSRRRKRRIGWFLIRWGLILGVWGVVVGGLGLAFFAYDLPRPEAALDAARRPSMTLSDTSGHLYASFGDVVGDPLRLSDLPAFLPVAAVSVEDRRFWSHPGFDLIGIARAITVNVTRGRMVQGGSTITQQVAKNLFLTNARTFKRKIQEMLLTLWLERHFTKEEILEIWLNRVYLGSGAWGVDAAAQMYFGISARKLNLWQSAVIAGLPRAPSRFSPRVDPKAAAARGRDVLAAMVETGAITADAAREAGAAIAFPPRSTLGAGYFADWAAERAQTVVATGSDAVVRTTLDPRMQALVDGKLSTLLDGAGANAGVGQGAVVVMDVATGAVRAMAGGRDYRTGPYNRAVVARRQPGSAFKLFVWLAALEHGLRPDDTVLDAPIRVGTWQPSNFDGKFHGEVTLEDALVDSLNTASVRLLQIAGGPRKVGAVAARLGLVDTFPDNATLALGTGEVGLLELAGAYASVFNGGRLVTPRALDSVMSDGKPVKLPPVASPGVLNPDIAAMMVRMLSAVVSRGSGRVAAVPGKLVAGKTGTTQDFRDAWFMGAVNPGGPGALVIGVWLGNDDNRSMAGITGGSLPARLFHDIAVEIKP